MDTSNNLTKKEQRETRREEKRGRQYEAQQKKKHRHLFKWAVAVLILGIAGYGLFLLILGPSAPLPGEPVVIQGKTHIPVGSSHPEYNSNPPTSGSHYARPTDWGVYRSELVDENVIHSLEHGGVWISYRPDIDEGTKENLEEIGRRYSGRTVVSPRAANDVPIAVAAWGRLEKQDAFDEDRIVEFIRRNTNRSPEPIAR